ncbi:MAG TPA: hypothetical protein DCZ49_00860 [Hyphomonadaceae bacterium]|jgi:CAAX amino terminal protease family.|nr:hypothetical protein [Hyphomonadaceae bacterium]
MQSKRWTIVLIVLSSLLVLEADSIWWPWLPFSSELNFSQTSAVLRVLASVAVVWFTVRQGLGFFGLFGNPFVGFAFGLFASVPLWAPLALTSEMTTNLDLKALAFQAGIYPLVEEIFYRAFAFGLLYRIAGLPFWAAALMTGIPFAAAHLYQADSLSGAIGTVAVTFLGAVLFSWLFKAWGWNLWAPFALHALMNFWWFVFKVGDGAFVGWEPTAMQLGCAGAAVVLTLLWRRWRGAQMSVSEIADHGRRKF